MKNKNTKTKLLLTFLISLSFLFGLTEITNACDYFVAQNSAGDASGTGSYTNRMSVATHNARAFSPGDTICLVDTISSQVLIPSSGTAGNRVTYWGGYEGHKGVLTANNSGGAIRGEYKDYVTIDGIEVKNGKIGIAFLNNCNHITIKKCIVHDMSAAGSKGIFVSSNTTPRKRNSNFIIGGELGDGNEIYNVGVDTGGGDINLSNIDNVIVSYNKCYAKDGEVNTGIDGVALTICDNGIIEYNELFNHLKSSSIPVANFGEDGIDLKGSTNVHVRYNHIHDNRAVGIGINQADAAGDKNCSNVYIYNNKIHDNGTNIVISDLDQNAYVYNNILYNSGKFHGISCHSDVGLNVHIYNNVFINNHGNDGTKYQLLIGSGTNYFVKNNIFYSDTNKNLVWKGSSTTNVNFDNNHYYYTGGPAKIRWDDVYKTLEGIKALGQEASGSEGDPKFTDIANNNFTLAEGSKCINTGATLNNDYANALDPINTNFTTFPPTVHTLNQNSYGAWEIGAFVYGAATTETAPVVNSFTANKTTTNTNEPITFSYSVKDDDGDLKQVELYRKKDSGAWLPVSGQIHSISGAGTILGTFIDTPTIAGTYQYGVHVVDNSGNIGYEPSEITATVNDIVVSCDYFVAQSSAGDASGNPYTNRMSVATHNGRTFSPGDTICLVDTISSQVIIPSSGTAGNRITYYGGYEGHKGVLTYNSGSGTIRGEEKSCITIDGLEIRNGSVGVTFINNCNDIIVKRCKIHDMKNKGITITSNDTVNKRNFNITIGGASGDGNEIFNVGSNTGSVDIMTNACDNVLVSYNECYANNTDTGVEGINCLGCTDGLIEYNTVYDHKKKWSLEYPDMGEDGIDVKASNRFIVRYNYVYGNRSGGIALIDSYGVNSNNTHVYNNGSSRKKYGTFLDLFTFSLTGL